MLSGREASLGAGHPDTNAAVCDLAGLLKSIGAYEDALPLYRRALAGDEATLGADHPSTLASIRSGRCCNFINHLRRGLDLFCIVLDRPSPKASVRSECCCY